MTFFQLSSGKEYTVLSCFVYVGGDFSMKLPGNRIVKTTVSVFLTAFICTLIGWPPVFAVITAIVTLEPTVSDSIKKGIVRFPASAIGSFYAVLFIALFGNSPITYTLAASLTIITCYRLKLHAGLLVAAITAVAMIEVIYDNYLRSEEHTSELQSRGHLVCRLLLEKKKINI